VDGAAHVMDTYLQVVSEWELEVSPPPPPKVQPQEPKEVVNMLEFNCGHHSTMETNSNQKREDKEIDTILIDFDCHLMVEINFRFPTNNNKLMLQGKLTKKSLMTKKS
jgi:hypothetical protein